MLTGDITSEVETIMLNNYEKELLDVDILKLSHHGSSGSTSYRFLETVTPSKAIISVGNNNYTHPANEVLSRIIEYDNEHHTKLFNNLYK